MKRKICLLFIIIPFLLIMLNENIFASHDNIIDHRKQWWLNKVNWDEKRDIYTGKNVSIAVIDSGIDMDIPELSSIDKENVSILNDEIVSYNAHGNGVCTIIGGLPQKEDQVLGVATNVSLVSIDITNDENGVVSVNNLIEGINLAIEKDVDIINLSVGTIDDSIELRRVIKKAYKEGITIVASAGNYMTNEMLYPAAYPEVIAVGSVDKKGNIISPKGCKKSNLVYLPGKNVVTSIGKNKYKGVYGTSFSTAICTGLIALIKEKNPEVTNEQIVDYFKNKGVVLNIDFNDILKDF